mgnify:CR=1 FL=1
MRVEAATAVARAAVGREVVAMAVLAAIGLTMRVVGVLMAARAAAARAVGKGVAVHST